MNSFPCNGFNDFLAKFPHNDSSRSQFFVCNSHCYHISFFYRSIYPKQQIRRSQIKEMQCMRLKYLPVMHQSAQFIGSR